MSFREGETNHFPFDRNDKAIWYAIILFDSRFQRFSYISSKSGKNSFVEQIDFLKSEGKAYLLLGVWQGNWKTDIFVLDEEITKKKIQDYL